MAKKIYKALKKARLQKTVKSLERRVVIANEHIRVLEKKYEEKIQKAVESLERKNRMILLPMEKETLSKKAYGQSIIDNIMAKFDEKQKWQKLAINHKLKKDLAKADANEKTLNLAATEKIALIDAKRAAKLNELEAKYLEEDLDAAILNANIKKYETKQSELANSLKDFESSLRTKYNNKLVKDREKNQITLQKLDSKLQKQYEVRNQIVNEERDELVERKSVLEQLVQNKDDEKYEENVQELDEINALFDMYEDDSILLRVKNLNMRFGGLKAVDNLSFDIKKGEIFGLIGPNGAGKTTVFNCITQFYKPTSGKVYFNRNETIMNLMDVQVHDVIKQGIVRTFQNVELVWELSILDNLLVASHTLYETGFFTQLFHLPSLKKEEDVIRAKALRVLEYLDLLPYKDFYPVGLPYGILKRIELARTFMTDPKLIILDEPAAGLNEVETKELATSIKQIAKDFGTTIFLVEHDMGLVMDVCDRICAINFGKKLAVGTPKEIQNNKLVQEAYLGGE